MSLPFDTDVLLGFKDLLKARLSLMWTKQDLLVVVPQTQVIDFLKSQAVDEEQPGMKSPPGKRARARRTQVRSTRRKLDVLMPQNIKLNTLHSHLGLRAVHWNEFKE
ncbi:hypothetical protein SARC_03200 [Sphaeroforma arctica JP610]|uniref:Uncharacterized protein n=1 Tax=Sphaeroforma arctica JP610 TaxID=667725 RepID=A0A0L0G6U8_9EUKA|nr:hypothetical protein SARC_03200 [Sphaeroforma arctica JP610]KNC84581.1 hypothetical protein SARC_03200 [Sphaeroforma arctica JP610]|eukprot:XP_014158483.1 hypothetical protein SARC_03200 [Sphaeroforma arctica JP610]